MDLLKFIPLKQNKITFLLLTLCLIFFIIEIYLNFHEIMTPDQFWFVYAVYHKYRISVPYRDFIPYKTILGNYLFLIPMYFVHDPFYVFVYVKNFVTLYDTLFLLGCSLWLTRHFPTKPVLMSVLFLLSSYFFLNISNDIRVDIFAYWICLVSVLFILENEFMWAGVVLGVAFCFSQKALWYGCAINFALLSLLFYPNRKASVKNLSIFNLSFVAIVGIYIAVWAYISDLQTVMNSVFYDAQKVYQINFYDETHLHALGNLLKKDILYLSLWMLTPISLLVKTDPDQQKKRIFLLVYAITVMVLLINYKQAFGYFAIAVIPALFVLYTDFFTWLSELSKRKIQLYVKTPELILLCIFLTLGFIYLKIMFFYLSFLFYLICLLPLLVGFHLLSCYAGRDYIGSFYLKIVYFIIVLVGMIVSSWNALPFPSNTGYLYQQKVIRLVNDLVEDGSTYVTSVNLLYDKEQPLSGNSFLEQSTRNLLQPNTELSKAMLPSLDLDPSDTLDKIIERLDSQPVKVFINAPTFERLPRLLDFLMRHYEHLWGNVYIYAPEVPAGDHSMQIKFIGRYKVESQLPVFLNGQKILPKSIIRIDRKTVQTSSTISYRLRLMPDNLPEFTKQFVSDVPLRLYTECSDLWVKDHKVHVCM